MLSRGSILNVNEGSVLSINQQSCSLKNSLIDFLLDSYDFKISYFSSAEYCFLFKIKAPLKYQS